MGHEPSTTPSLTFAPQINKACAQVETDNKSLVLRYEQINTILLIFANKGLITDW